MGVRLGLAYVHVHVEVELRGKYGRSKYSHSSGGDGIVDRAAYYLLLTTHYAPRTTHHAPRTTHYSLLTTHSALRTPHSALRTPHYSLLLRHFLLACEAVVMTESTTVPGSAFSIWPSVSWKRRQWLRFCTTTKTSFGLYCSPPMATHARRMAATWVGMGMHGYAWVCMGVHG